MSLWVKYCGIRRAEDAECAIELGVDAIGVVAVPSSQRCAASEDMRAISRLQRGDVTLTLVVQDSPRDDVLRYVDALTPDVLQFHGSESVEFCESFGLPYIKATRDPEMLSELSKFRSAAAPLVDLSGDIDTFHLKCLNRWILAGGLTAENVVSRTLRYHPWGVDVSRGIEQSPGVKDMVKMREFLRMVRGVRY